MRKTKEDAEKTKQHLIDAGIDIFSQRLYSDVNISDIAKMAGVTRGAVYWHFKNKAELFKEIHNIVESEIMKVVEEAIAKGSTIYERSFSIFNDVILTFKNTVRLQKISRLMSINQGILIHDDFKDWHKCHHMEEKKFYTDLIKKITEGTDIDSSIENNDIDIKHEFIAAAAFLHGMMNFITFGSEMEVMDLSDTDIAKIVNIFLTGLCPANIPFTRTERKSEENIPDLAKVKNN